MANILKKVSAKVQSNETSVHTSPEGSTLTIVGLHATNISDSNVNIDVLIDGFYYAKNVLIPYGGGYEFIEPGSKLVINSGESISAVCSADESIDIIVSFLEQNGD